jgi:hypothetical protein
MKTERQMYQEYIEAQERKLEELTRQLAKTKEDIDNVTKLMLACPYEEQDEISQDD